MTEATKYNEVPSNNVSPIANSEEPDLKKEKKVQQLVKAGAVKPIKRNLIQRLVHGLLGENGIRGLIPYVRDEILIPRGKDMLDGALTAVKDGLIYGPDGNRKPNPGSNYNSWNQPSQSYNYSRQPSYTNNKTNYATQHQVPIAAAPMEHIYGVKPYMIPGQRSEGERVLNQMLYYVDQFGSISVSDYYDIIGAPSDFAGMNYGWNDLSSATVRSVRGGTVIDFPPTDIL